MGRVAFHYALTIIGSVVARLSSAFALKHLVTNAVVVAVNFQITFTTFITNAAVRKKNCRSQMLMKLFQLKHLFKKWLNVPFYAQTVTG